MKPISLRLKGFIGIFKGMGREEITLDLSNLSGLIAFDSRNGSGKTTILDCLHPYRRLASRSGSYQHHVMLRDSEKEYVFELDGNTYKTLVKIDAHTGRQEGFIWKNNEPQVNGKVSEYDRYIENLIGSETLFFNSVFCAQGSQKLSDLTAGKLKELFAEFLRLDRFQAWEETAKQAGNKLQALADGARGKIDAAQANTPNLEDITADIEVLTFRKSEDETRLAESEDMLKAAMQDKDDLVKVVAENQAKRQQINDISNSISALSAKIAKGELRRREIGTEMQARIDDVQKKIRANTEDMAAKGDAKGLKAELAQANTQINTLVAEREALESSREDIRTTIDAEAENLLFVRKSIDDINTEITNFEKQIGQHHTEIERLKNNPEAAKLRTQIKFTAQAAGKLKDRDPDCKSETCVFIVDAVQAAKDLPAMKEKLAAMEAATETEIDRQHKLIVDLASLADRDRSKIKPLTAKAIDSESKISSLKAELRKNEAMLHGKANDIQKLKLTIDQLNFKIESLPDVSKLEAENVALKSRWQDLEVDMKAKLDEADAWLEETRNEKAGLENRIAEIVICDYADNRLAIAEAAIKRHTQEIDSLKTSISGINSKLAVLEHQKQAAVDLEVKVREYKTELFRLADQISKWRYLQNACGKDGLRALEIDGTAPLISAYANDLLTATFGTGQTIGFRTQNEDGKEVLDIVAYRDGDAAEGTLIDKLSGGERVWSLKALRLALTLVSKMKSTRNFQTAFSDEEDGALDAENAQSFINMYRAFMDAGGFESIIYITHRDECKALADHIIRLSGKGIEIESREMVRRAA